MDEHPALALREKKDASILVAIDLVQRGEADAVVTAGHTGAGMAAAVLRLGRLPGVDRPALAVQMITDDGPDRPPRHRRQPRLDRREPRPVRADGRDLRRARPGRRATRASRCCRSARRRARATPGSSARPSCSTRPDLRFVGNVEGKDLTHHLADVVVCDAVLGNVVIKFFEGLSTFIFDLWRGRVPSGRSRGRLGVPARCARASAGSAAIFDYERVGGSPLLGRPRHGHHHPRPSASGGWSATPARWRRRRPGPGSRRSSPRRSRAAAAATRPAARSQPEAA